MTAVLTSTNTNTAIVAPTTAPHFFRMSDGKLVSAMVSTSGFALKRWTSADGVTWTAADPTALTALGVQWMLAVQSGDVIYGMVSTGSTNLTAFKWSYAAGAFTDTTAAIAYSGGMTAFNSLIGAIAFDSVKSVIHVLVGLTDTGSVARNVLIAFDTTLTKKADISVTTATLANGDLRVDGSATPNVYVVAATSASSTITVYLSTFSGTAYSAISSEAALSAANTGPASRCALDQNANLDLFFYDGGALKTTKRTGVNAYAAVTTLVASGVKGGTGDTTFSLCETNNTNADLFLLYSFNTNQTNGEIYQIKRLAGVWQIAASVAGGANTGWVAPSAIRAIQADAKAHMVYLTGTTTISFTYDGSLVNGQAPSAPINVAPTGTANTSLTPTCSSTYKNTANADALGKYRVLVTRQSDGVVFWDTGAAGTAYTGTAITDGGTFSLTYAGTALVKGTIYLIAMNFWDSIASLAGPLSTAVAFVINDAPTVTITGPTPFATEPSSGLAVTWTYAQTLSHVQASFQVKVLNAGQTSTIYDSGVQSGAATSWTVPVGTLANATAYVLSVQCLSTDAL